MQHSCKYIGVTVNAPLCNSLHLFLSLICNPSILTNLVENVFTASNIRNLHSPALARVGITALSAEVEERVSNSTSCSWLVLSSVPSVLDASPDLSIPSS